MTLIEKTTNIKIDEDLYVVADQSSQVQQLVAILDDWRQDEQDERAALTKTAAAIRDLQRELINVIMEEKKAASAAASTEETDTPPAE